VIGPPSGRAAQAAERHDDRESATTDGKNLDSAADAGSDSLGDPFVGYLSVIETPSQVKFTF
jgi:hypothetical protein